MKNFPTAEQVMVLMFGFGMFFLAQVLLWGAFGLALIVRGC